MPKKKIKKAVLPITASDIKKWLDNLMYEDCEESQNKILKYYQNKFNKFSYNLSNWIHENEYQPMNCCLCGKEMTSIHDTNNPFPLTPKCLAVNALEDSLPHRCCNDCCIKKVAPARLEIIKPKKALEVDVYDFAQPVFRNFYKSISKKLGLPIQVHFYVDNYLRQTNEK